MIGKFRRLFSGRAGPAPTFDAPLVIDRPTYAIGDVHGREDLLTELLAAIDADARASGIEDHRLVFLGDYVDRGENSAGVLAILREALSRDRGSGDDVVALLGNHEAMLLGFLDDPAREGPRWLANGGLQTLMSYGVGGIAAGADPAALADAAARLKQAMGPDEAMLRGLRTHALFGSTLFAHAGADPELPADMQPEQVLLWGSGRFRREPRWDGIWVVHGHYVTEAPAPVAGRIPVDTGAYFSGVLSAARLRSGEVRYLTT